MSGALTHPLPTYLVEGYQRWRGADYEKNRATFANLAAEGQRPRTMLIQCSDSRVDSVASFGAGPGDLFVVRNVANLVPPSDAGGAALGVGAALEYGVNVLRVAHLIVLGHSGCGGVAACEALCSGQTPELADDPGFIGPWIEMLRPAWERADVSEDRTAAFGREAVLLSLENLMTFPFVQRACDEGELALHGAWMDIAPGELHVHEPGQGFRAL